VTEATYIAEALIPLIAFGLPLSPVAAGPAAPLFNAPPRFTVDAATGQVNNLHNMMSAWEFLGYGLIAVALAALVAYPFAMNHARNASAFVSRRLSHEAIIAPFVGLVLVIGMWEGQALGLLVILTVGLVGGLLYRTLGLNPDFPDRWEYSCTNLPKLAMNINTLRWSWWWVHGAPSG
jgi:ABC-type spermidine/putrescine transport system permease subunit I